MTVVFLTQQWRCMCVHVYEYEYECIMTLTNSRILLLLTRAFQAVVVYKVVYLVFP